MVLTSRSSSLAGLLVAAAILYLARDVLIPLALAILLSFLLAPVVRRLEQLRLGRVLATLVALAIAFSIIGGVGWIAAQQALSLAVKLPEYRANITKKIRAVRAPQEGTIGKAAEAIKELENEAAPADAPLAVTETPPTAFAAVAEMAAPFVKPLGIALAVIVFTMLMLLKREDMRDRLIALIGAGRINVTTQALGEASERVSRYLLMQLVVNGGFGLAFGIALHFIGIPNAMLWGLLTTLLRFIPYGGIWIAVGLPLLLAFAISDGWALVAWTIGAFVALELLFVYAVEPWLYGRSTGLSAIAIIAAVIFWTWLWGPVGLLLAMPLTVCIAVMGRYIPELGYLNVLLGVEPVLTPEARFYQRLVALDQDEAMELAGEFHREHGAQPLYDQLIIPALALAEIDRHKGALDPERERSVFDTARQIIEEFGDDEKASRGAALAGVAIVPAHDEADEIAAAMLARLAPGASVVSPDKLEAAHGVVCVSAVPPHAASHAAHMARGIKRTNPGAKVLVALWTSEGLDRIKPRLLSAGVDEVVTRLEDALTQLRRLAPGTASR